MNNRKKEKNTSNRKKLPCLCDKGDKNCKHDDVKKRALAAKIEKWEIKWEVTKVIWVNLEKLLSKRRMKLW